MIDTGFLFNLLQKAKQVRDFVVTQGPVTINTTADYLEVVVGQMRSFAAYLAQFPGQVVEVARAPGSVGTDAHDYLTEIKKIRDEVANAPTASAQQGGTTPHRQHSGLAGSATRGVVAAALVELCDNVLHKSGFDAASGQPEQEQPQGPLFKAPPKEVDEAKARRGDMGGRGAK
jgi:hypothetical protein